MSWPGDLACVVALAIDFDGPSHDVGQGYLPLGARATGRYSARRGVPRHLAMLERRGVPATFFIPGYDAECYPDVVREIAAQGHEIGAHGYLHERELFAPDEERRRLALTHEILTRLTGKPPRGWRSPSGQKTRNTLLTLHELGYAYDASDKDFDVPYLLDLEGGRSMVEIPNNTYSLDDFPFFHFSMTPASEVLALWKDEFDAIYRERGFFLLSVHPRCGWGSGTPARTAVLEELVAYIQGHEGVGFLTLAQVADWVAARPAAFDEVRA